MKVGVARLTAFALEPDETGVETTDGRFCRGSVRVTAGQLGSGQLHEWMEYCRHRCVEVDRRREIIGAHLHGPPFDTAALG
jgi:hypothetical protein